MLLGHGRLVLHLDEHALLHRRLRDGLCLDDDRLGILNDGNHSIANTL